jgi:hypothetical protein
MSQSMSPFKKQFEHPFDELRDHIRWLRDGPLDIWDGKNFLGHLKKKIVQRNVAEKKILASIWGMKKNLCTEKLPTPPQISNGPSLMPVMYVKTYVWPRGKILRHNPLLLFGSILELQLSL